MGHNTLAIVEDPAISTGTLPGAGAKCHGAAPNNAQQLKDHPCSATPGTWMLSRLTKATQPSLTSKPYTKTPTPPPPPPDH